MTQKHSYKFINEIIYYVKLISSIKCISFGLSIIYCILLFSFNFRKKHLKELKKSPNHYETFWIKRHLRNPVFTNWIKPDLVFGMASLVKQSQRYAMLKIILYDAEIIEPLNLTKCQDSLFKFKIQFNMQHDLIFLVCTQLIDHFARE